MTREEQILNFDCNLSAKYTDSIIAKYSEPWRVYHTLDHVDNLINTFIAMRDKGTITGDEADVLRWASVFHDVIYFPWNIKVGDEYVLGKSNEELSADYFTKFWNDNNTDEDYEIYSEAHKIILNTETHKSENEIQKIFMQEDEAILHIDNWVEMLNWEKQIHKEYNIASTKDYKKGRLAFIDGVLMHHDSNPLLYDLKKYVKAYKPRVGFYAGSFNPFHKGHLDILNKAKQMFDKVVILTGQNPLKPKITTEDFEKRKLSIFKKTACEIVFVEGLLADYLQKREDEGDEEIFLIKGFRDAKDIAYEQTNDKFSKEFYPNLKTIFIPSEPELNHVSSSAIKAIKAIDKKKAKQFIPKNLF
jgi:pantetheine-phosphate adenylyltransferase